MTCGRVPFVRRRADSVVAPLPWWLPGAGAACARTCAPVTIALHRCRLDAGDSARDVLPHPRRAPSETGAPFGGVPFRPVVFPDFAGDTLERRASIMPALSNNAPHYGARFLKVKRHGMRRPIVRRIRAGRWWAAALQRRLAMEGSSASAAGAGYGRWRGGRASPCQNFGLICPKTRLFSNLHN